MNPKNAASGPDDRDDTPPRTGWSNRTLGCILALGVFLWFLFAVGYIWWY